MVRAVRAVSSEIGRDPGDFVLFAFGGSGPVHASTLAREANMADIIVPPSPGVFSAVGLLLSTVEHQYVQTFWRDLSKVDAEQLENLKRLQQLKRKKEKVGAEISDLKRKKELVAKKQFACEDCEKSFTRPYTRDKHMKMKHGH